MKFGVWLVSLLAVLMSLYFCFESGFLAYVVEVDVSKLSLVILAVFMLAYLRLGKVLWSGYYVSDDDLEPGYFMADISMSLGLLGTVVGFIHMTSQFAGVDFSDVANIQDLFAFATTGMSTALYTTAVGLISAILIRVSHYIVEKTA